MHKRSKCMTMRMLRQQMYDDAYAQAEQQVNQAIEQAQNEVNEAISQTAQGFGLSAQTTEESGNADPVVEIIDDSKSDSDNDSGSNSSKKASVSSKIKDYVKRNAASFGYYSLGGERIDDGYGGTLDTLKLVLVSKDGKYIDISDDNVLKQYVVIDQSIEPDSEIVFDYNEFGMSEHQTYPEIVLLCKKLREKSSTSVLTHLTRINPSPDKTTQYIKDYVGRNLATVGYEELDGRWHDEYNGTFNTVDIVVITDDGSYIEPGDEQTQKQYVVTSQNPAANTELRFNYNSYGMMDSQTYSEIEVFVSKLQ